MTAAKKRRIRHINTDMRYTNPFCQETDRSDQYLCTVAKPMLLFLRKYFSNDGFNRWLFYGYVDDGKF